MAWGGSFVAVKHALQYLSPLELLFARFVPAASVFALLLYSSQGRDVLTLVRAEWRSLCLMGLSGVVIYHLALNTGEQLIPAGTASLIMALNPAFIFLLSVLLQRERITWLRLLGLCVAFCGLFIVIRFATSSEIGFGYLRGVLITLVAPLSWAVYTALARPLAVQYAPLSVTGMATIVGSLPIVFVARLSLLDRLAVMPWHGWASVAFLSLVSSVAGVTVWVMALERLEASQVGALIHLVPLWATMLSQLLLGEPLSGSLFIGGLVVISGVVLVNRQ
jgi:drug/metabolite transporter (DMT)-like permease